MSGEDKNRAYAEAFKFLHTKIDKDAIYAKLEKQGFEKELAKQVAQDVIIERIKEENKDKLPMFKIGIAMIVVGLVVLLISFVFLPGFIILPSGFIVGGSVIAAMNTSKRKS